MRNQIKSIIRTSRAQKGVFLTIINEKGRILNINAAMKTELHVQHKSGINFFDLLSPGYISEFKEILRLSGIPGETSSAVTCIKNGDYHQVNWQINRLKDNEGDKLYLCLGHKISVSKKLQQLEIPEQNNFQRIFGKLAAGILTYDSKSELITANQKAAEIFKSSMAQINNLNDFENLWDTSWDCRTKSGHKVNFEDSPFVKASRTGQTQAELLRITLKSGDNRWVHFSSQPICEENNIKAGSVITIITDKTEEIKISEELKEKIQLFSSFMEHTTNLTWVIDDEATLLFANDAFYRFFELKEKDSLNRNIMELIPKSVVDALYEKHMSSLQTGNPVESYEKIKWADGTDLIFHINLFLVGEGTGKKKIGGYAINISDRYSIERKLRDANDRLLFLTSTTTDAIWEWDMQSGHIYRNDTLLKMVGFSNDKSKGLSWWLKRIHPEERNRVCDQINETTKSGKQSWVDEYRFKCADGTYKHMRDKGYIVYENGLPVKMIGSLQDVSDLKILESRLLDEKIDRQKELSETVIRVQEMERTRIGHELHDNVNQVLTSARLFVELLSQKNEEQHEIKERALGLLSDAIEEIRLLSKEMVAPQLKAGSVKESILSLIEEIHTSTKIIVRFTYNLSDIELSRGLQVTLFRIVQEQLKNIIRHSEAKEVWLIVEGDESIVNLKIKDDGIGFNPRKTRRGIGLSNIYERTRFYSGVVELDTAPGKGCHLKISIPLVK